MRIAIGNDHIVTDKKNEIINWLKEQGHEIINVGTNDNIRTHYPIYGRNVALEVVKGNADVGIVICGTGVGISNGANKVKGARVVLTREVLGAKMARERLDANVLGLGGRITGVGLMQEIITTFLNTKFINSPENNKMKKSLDEKIKVLNKDKGLLDEELEKWREGFYTNGEKQK